jgi:DNA-directed RNA polymerase subunit RPC12/RpoP
LAFGQTLLLQYSCSKCGTLLKEIKVGNANVKLSNLEEECPKCGSVLLVRTLKREWKLNEELQSQQQLSSDSSSLLPKFQTAYEQISDRLTFDIEKIDSILSPLTAGEGLCIIGEKYHTHTLIARLCVRALMSKRQGGFDCQNILFVDSGNSVDVYQYMNFARQYGLDIKKVLRSIIASRSFNLYQLANTIMYKLPKVIQQYNPKIIVVISDLLDMFLRDPQILIEEEEAEHIIKEIINSVKKMMMMPSRNVSVLVSCSRRQHFQSTIYEKIILSAFHKCIEITSCENNLLSLSFNIKKVRDNNNNNSGIKSYSSGGYGSNSSNSCLLQTRDLSLVTRPR